MTIRQQLFANNAKTTLASTILSSDTSITLVDASRFPLPTNGQYFLLTLEVGATIEILECSTRVGNVLTVVRARENTIASGFVSGTSVEVRVTSATLQSFAKSDSSMSQLSSVELLTSPSTSNGTSYVCYSLDDGGNPTIAVKNSSSIWSFTNYSTKVFTGTISISPLATLTEMSSTVTPTLVGAVIPGRYLLQFTSGQLAGTVRPIVSHVNGRFTWTTSSPSLPVTGDQFEVYKSTYSDVSLYSETYVQVASNQIVGGNKTFSAATKFSSPLVQSIVASTPYVGYTDVCLHLAKDDTDKGAWRKRKGQSWRSEVRSVGNHRGAYATATLAVAAGAVMGDVYYNTTSNAFHEVTAPTTSSVTYRAGREDYPTNALITAEAGRVIIWDLDGAAPTMWMVFMGALGALLGSSSITSIAASGSTLVIGHNNGLAYINFISEKLARYFSAWTNNTGLFSGVNIASRNINTSGYGQNIIPAIVNAVVNDVAITILPDAPQDEFGMPVPTIAVATAGGTSVINNDGLVKSSAIITANYYCSFDSDGTLYVMNNVPGSRTYRAYLRTIYTTPAFAETYKIYASNDATPTFPYNIPSPVATLAIGVSKVVSGSSVGFSVFKNNQSLVGSGMVSYVTSTYNTGYMVGDIRRCFLANSKTLDRSVKAATLTQVGTVTETIYTGGRSVYSGFSATNYLQEATSVDWNALGTGDFSIIMSGVKWGTAATNRALIGVVQDIPSAGEFALVISTEYLSLLAHNGTAWAARVTSTMQLTDTAEHTVEVSRSTVAGVAATLQLKVDGVVVGSAVYASTLSNLVAPLRIGAMGGTASGVYPWAGGQVSCVRISATAPIEEQSKYMGARENALNSGVNCLLSSSSSVTSFAYDKDTDSLLVGTGTSIDTFQELKRISTQSHGVTVIAGMAALNGLSAVCGAGLNYTAPERNISAELLESKTQLQISKKFYITGTGATTYSLQKGWKPVDVRKGGLDMRGGLGFDYTVTYDGFIYNLVFSTAVTAGVNISAVCEMV